MCLQQDANMLFVVWEHKNKKKILHYYIKRTDIEFNVKQRYTITKGNNNIFLNSYTGNTCLLCFITPHKHTNRRPCYTQTFTGSGAQHITNLCAPSIYTLPCTITGKLWDLLGRTRMNLALGSFSLIQADLETSVASGGRHLSYSPATGFDGESQTGFTGMTVFQTGITSMVLPYTSTSTFSPSYQHIAAPLHIHFLLPSLTLW